MASKKGTAYGGKNQTGFSPRGYLLVSLLFLVLALALLIWSGSSDFITSPLGGVGIYLILLIASMAFAAFIFGVMQSYATYSGKQFSGQLKLGGPIVGAALVMAGAHFFLKELPTPVEAAPQPVAVKFQMKFTEGELADIWSKDRVTYIQERPKHNRYDMIPQVAHEDFGEYLRDNVVLPPTGEIYRAKILRKPEEAVFIDDPAAIPKSKICFEVTGPTAGEKELHFICKEGGDAVAAYEYDWLEKCDGLSQAGFFSVTPAYAAVESTRGWVVPSLPTLRQKNRDRGTSYTAFTIQADRLPGLEQSESYTYQIFVNGVAIYIDGLTREDTRTTLAPETGFELTFGLENLDFSGAKLGDETIRVELDFYAGDDRLKRLTLERPYVALREVVPEKITTDGITFEWTGDYVIGRKQDGFQVFIWSTRSPSEVTRRKELFDAAELHFEGKKAVSVIRPPWKSNRAYGLLVGLYDRAGKIKFTFGKSDARRILSWVKQDVAPRPQSLAKRDAYLRRLIGD